MIEIISESGICSAGLLFDKGHQVSLLLQKNLHISLLTLLLACSQRIL